MQVGTVLRAIVSVATIQVGHLLLGSRLFQEILNIGINTYYQAQVRPDNGTGSRSRLENPLSGTKDDGSGWSSSRCLSSLKFDGMVLVQLFSSLQMAQLW
jgi:hypothetical protein